MFVLDPPISNVYLQVTVVIKRLNQDIEEFVID